MIRTFDQLFHEVRHRPKRTLIVPAAEGQSILQACAEAQSEGICDVIAVGDEPKIRSILQQAGLEAGRFEIVHEPDPDCSVDMAMRMIREGRANLLMKGKTDTPTLLRVVLDADRGLRTGRVLSHVAVVEMPSYDRLMLWTDGGLNIRPDLEKRLDIIRNAVEFAGQLGVERPAVALLSATEKVNPKMEETLDYENILKLQAAEPFVAAVIEGPLAMDIALSRESARIKEVDSAIAGATDIFVTPEISTCNIAVKALIYLAGAKASGLVVGARVPIVLLSRADDYETKLRSIALGAIWA
jgi:phosphate butyryltransferase